MVALVVAGLSLQRIVSSQSILTEMGDLNRLLEPADYTYAQASSYDRTSTKPGDETWFANADYGQYIRTESREGRKENVMAELTGPGAIVRIWSANPSGTIRFYVDGNSQPQIECDFEKLFSTGVAPTQLGYVFSRGYNLYFPIPYRKSVKVTLEGPEANHVYYQIGYRSYPPNTPVQSFDLQTDYDTWNGSTLPKAAPDKTNSKQTVSDITSAHPARILGTGVVSELTLEIETRESSWRELPITILVDGEATIDSTVGDLFGCPDEARPYQSQVMDVTPQQPKQSGFKRALFTFKLPQPFSTSFQVSMPVTKSTGKLTINSAATKKNSAFKLFSQTNVHAGPSRPFRDMRFMRATGRGRYVGTLLTVENPVSQWWGEGDEKVYVNDETFPSIFGTGTEDYFGYAWCSTEVHTGFFNGQPRADGPGNFGHSTNYRWHTFDDIPFQSSLQFDLEMWHWADTNTSYTSTCFWYGEPGKTKITRPQLPPVRTLVAGKPVEGALEGEDMKVLSATGGTTEIQGQFIETSKFKQLWWKFAKTGDALKLQFPVAKAGRYRIEAHLCQARDYGIHQIEINGKTGLLQDFYSPDLKWSTFDLGIHDLNAGQAEFIVTSRGHNEKAEPAHMFGLDYIKLIPLSDPSQTQR